ncbi:MAG: helix-turn-helix domain-containing protein [Anaerotignum sp.]|nr:helix-turn-helix domain-containing protein [Anaerotignum sp.]
MIYQRLLSVYTQLLKGKTITEAALEAGFSSPSHFADVNRRIFGLSATNITRNLHFIKIE